VISNNIYDTTTVVDTVTTNDNRTVSPISIKGRASVLHGHILLQYTCIIISLIIYIVRYHISLTPLLLDTPFNVVAAVVTISVGSDPGSIIRKH
jgi:hypothetical protein